jgi:hypothetical protein
MESVQHLRIRQAFDKPDRREDLITALGQYG